MAGAKLDPEILAHREWIGFVRPTGPVVSPPALVRAGAILNRRDAEGQRLFRACVVDRTFDPKQGPVPHLPDFRRFAESVLDWSFSPKGYAGTSECPIPAALEVPLPDYGETLRPDFAVRELEPKEGASSWQLLVQVLDPGEDFDHVVRRHGQLEASAHSRMERLLRQTGVSAGLLCNGCALRLVSAPRGESSGWLDFRVADMVETAGRPISTALRLLLDQQRLLSLPRAQRLAALLEDSRKFQNEVSERLAEQVLHALYEFLRGFQAAHDASKGELLRETLAAHPDAVYRALLTVILRLVFLLYAEERDMLPEDETFLRYYSLAGLYEHLREDVALFPDTMDQRYGAWAQLLVLFRMIYDGAEFGAMRLPERHGVLFDPDRFTFLEGRPSGRERGVHERIEPPLVPDGTIYRALENLLVLDGERISYRALDVEQIGSVYETMMGFRLETATGRSVAIRAQKKEGAPTAVDLEALLREPMCKREKWIEERADRKLSETVKMATGEAMTVEDLHAALLPIIDLAATSDLVPMGAMVLQPSEERRRSGSHYTPRALTEPIVRTTLEPILARLRGPDGRPPRPVQILDLKICDPAMGSGAFLVEACRQLGDALVQAWRAHGEVPAIPPDEDELIFAMRLVAQRCLYGVDRNPMAVDLAKVSLWLATLAKDHALTFVDHALRHGDSLVGLSRKQIEAFHWDPDAPRFQAGFETMQIRDRVAMIAELRRRIREADEAISDWALRDLWEKTQFELGKVQLFSDLAVAAFFKGRQPKEREAKRSEYASAVVTGEAESYRGWLEDWRHAEQPLVPFHWEIEFPEVSDRNNGGFDCMVGNPPFLGSSRISEVAGGPVYQHWLKAVVAPSKGQVDLSVFFFHRSFSLIRERGTLGLLATGAISYGENRIAGLAQIISRRGTIYCAVTAKPWPGESAVLVSSIHVCKCESQSFVGTPHLDGSPCDFINSRLQATAEFGEPQVLLSNVGLAHIGTKISSGFVLDRDEAVALLQIPENKDVVLPLTGGEEVTAPPSSQNNRFAICFGTKSLDEAARWPRVLELVRDRVRPQRMKSRDHGPGAHGKKYWWQHVLRADPLYEATAGLRRCLVISEVSTHHALRFESTNRLFNHKVYAFAFDNYAAFSILQSSIHELWSSNYSARHGATINYSPRKTFATFPLPPNWETQTALEAAGKAYYQFRDALMVKNNEGLTTTYNRFQAPDEQHPDILKLREVHAAMDRAVLDAYGWSDVKTDCEFLLDYEINEEDWGNKKKPWRYRWPDEVRDEVLARLLELNAERAKEEARSGAVAPKKGVKRPGAKRALTTADLEDLFT
jgi:hypothetical protein